MSTTPTESSTYKILVEVVKITSYRDSYTRELISSEEFEVASVSGVATSLDSVIGKGRMLLQTLRDHESGVTD